MTTSGVLQVLEFYTDHLAEYHKEFPKLRSAPRIGSPKAKARGITRNEQIRGSYHWWTQHWNASDGNQKGLPYGRCPPAALHHRPPIPGFRRRRFPDFLRQHLAD